MTKLAVMMLATLALTGCPKKKDETKQVDPAPKVVEPPKPDETKPPEDKVLTPEQKPVAAYPAECTDYQAAITRASACEKLATRDELKNKFDEQWAAWDKLDDAGRTAAAAECKTLATSVKEATTKACP